MRRYLHLVHSMLFWLVFGIAFIFLYSLFCLLSFFIREPFEVFQKIIRFVMRLILLLGGVRICVTGMDNIHSGQGMIFAANHPGFIDFMLHYVAFPLPFRFVIAYTFFRVPILSKMVGWLRYIPVGEGEEKKRRVKMRESGFKIISALKKRENLFVFPEGQRKKLPGEAMARFRTWPARIAIASGAPLVPIAVSGSEKILPKMRFLLYPGTVRIAIGEPLYFDKSISAEAATLELQAKIQNLYNSF